MPATVTVIPEPSSFPSLCAPSLQLHFPPSEGTEARAISSLLRQPTPPSLFLSLSGEIELKSPNMSHCPCFFFLEEKDKKQGKKAGLMLEPGRK
jgi:hypothetical protein